MFAYWDDLNLSGSGNGIYTLLTGTAPNRTWTIQWKGVLYGTSTAVNFAAQFREGSSTFDLVYTNGSGASGQSATIGAQSASSGTNFRQYSLNTSSVSSGTKLTATLPSCTSGTGPCP